MMIVPGGPKLLKGAILSAPYDSSSCTIVPFQYNPETMTRSLTPRYVGGEDQDQADMVRFDGAPKETIQADIVIDATDDLEKSVQTALQNGINPQLAALELLIYPTTNYITSTEPELLNQGTTEIIAALVPLTLFVWGALRVVPVRIDSMNVSEEAYDGLLNPIRATVSLTMQVLSYSDLDPDSLGYQIFLTYHTKLEQIAAVQNVSGESQAVTLQTTFNS